MMDNQPLNNSRRDLLKHSTFAALAAGTAGLSLNSAVHGGVEDSVKVGLIGCGGRGTGAAKQACSTSGKVKLVAVADAFEDNAKSAIDQIKKSLPSDKQDRVVVDA